MGGKKLGVWAGRGGVKGGGSKKFLRHWTILSGGCPGESEKACSTVFPCSVLRLLLYK